MNDTLERLEALASRRAEELLAQKAAGTPLVEFFGRFIPEELIRACGAGAHPLAGGGVLAPADAAQEDMLSCMNPLARSIASGIKLGVDRMAKKADLVVTAVTDIHMGRLSELLEFWGLNVCKVGVPSDWRKDIAFEYYLGALRRMVDSVCRITGRELDMDLARRYFSDTNRIYAAFRHIKELRKREGVPLSFEDYIRLQHLSYTLCGSGLAADALEGICGQLDGAESVYGGKPVRVLLVGRALASGDRALLRQLDSAGVAVVAEMLDECCRVSERDVELDGDVVANYARCRYLESPPPDSFQPAWADRFGRMLSLMEEYRCKGVVWYQLAYDEVYDMEYTAAAKRLAELDIPVLRLETDYSYTGEYLALTRDQIAKFAGELRAR